MTANTTSAPIEGTGDWIAIAGPGIAYLGVEAGSSARWAIAAASPVGVVGHPLPETGSSGALPEGIPVASGVTLWIKARPGNFFTVTPATDPA